MAASIDYSKLRNATLGSSQEEEAVTVNTRALIDKVLARYSGEWTTLRELIQNAADASASKVAIKFETLPSSTVPTPQSSDSAARLRHTILHHTLRSLKVTNNGQPFAETDWARLKRIAEGNPDETKIGAFGVGFYSVFSECEDPFVISGDQSMAFYWKGNSLFTRRATIPSESATKETCFVLDYRNQTSPVPSLMSICQFLSSSLTFVGLDTIELWLDEWNVFTLNKKSAPASDVSIPRDVDTKTKEGTMKITAVESQNAQIDASWTNVVGWVPSHTASSAQQLAQDDKAPSLRSFFSRITGASSTNVAARKAAKEEQEAQEAIYQDISGKSQATIFIRISTVHIKTSVSSSFAAELERATKKPPPKTTKIAILTSSYDEQTASMSTLQGAASRKVAEVITSVLPSKNGRIFIGFPTAQTTGLLAHISAPSLIPTVERENIDLNARYVRTWNSEILSVAGIACRIAYSGEMAILRDQLNGVRKSNNNTLKDSDIEAVTPAAAHVFNQYTFRESTPLPKAGTIIEESFWTCHRKTSIEMLSSQGVLSSADVRISSENLSFVKGIPVVPDSLMKDAKQFISKLQDYGLITDITTSDIGKELERQALTEGQLEEFLKWSAKKARSEFDIDVVQSLFGVTVANVQVDETSQRLLVLGDMKSYVNSAKISSELPVPPYVVPFRFTKTLNPADLTNFGWEELQIVPWLRWLTDASTRSTLGVQSDLTQSQNFSGQVLATISKNFDSLSASSKQSVVEILSPLTVIPTKLGMRRPADSYFPTVKLFDDLPVISGLNSVKEKVLKALGVRKTIELAVIFDRLMTSGKDGQANASWSHVDLIRYLVSVWGDIPDSDINQLRKTPLCPSEDANDPKKAGTKRYKVSELFEPKGSLRGLGLPLLQWPGQWNSYGNDGKFLRSLGLRPHPSASELVDIIAGAHRRADSHTYEAGLAYFIEHYYQNNYGSSSLAQVQIPFVPIDGSDKLKVTSPSDCFTDPRASVLGFSIMRKDLWPHAEKLGVQKNPPIHECALRLIKNPPTTKQTAKTLFGYFATRLGDLPNNVADRLGNAAIVPIPSRSHSSENDRKYRMTTPVSCFLGDAEEYGDIFDYVDFGEEANLFLLKVGSKHEPTTLELTRNVVREPARILEILQVDRYLGLLRKLHLNISTLKRDKVLWKEMRKAPFLLGYREKTSAIRPTDGAKHQQDNDMFADAEDDDVESSVKEWRLRSAERLTIVDDLISFSLFKEHLDAAPQEENLEEFYWALGTRPVSELVDEESRLGPRVGDQKDAGRLRDLILERSRLFLHEQSPGTTIHDIKWMEKNLQIQLVSSISLRRTLKGTSLSHTERRTAAITNKSLLSFTQDFDWFHISQEIVNLIIDRPRTQIIMLFEMFCTTSLPKLRQRGYNVERVLRKKEAEKARIAEMENQKRREDEQRRIQLEKERAALLPAAGATTDVVGRDIPQGESPQQSPYQPQQPQQPSMPGAFDNSPPSERPRIPSAKMPFASRNFFNTLKERLGLDNDRGETSQSGTSQDLTKFLGGSGSQGSNGSAMIRQTKTYDPHQVKGAGQNESVTAPDRVQQNLQSAINAGRSWNSTSVFSRPETNVVKEMASYCDSRPGANLVLIATTRVGIQVFVDKESADPAGFYARNSVGIENFGVLLMDCAQVFGMRKQDLHIFFDQSGGTIAFNSNGSLFCNYRFFAQLHQVGMQDIQARSQATVYWWVVLCHELAHNLVADHSSDHSYYTEQFVAEYFASMVGLLTRMAGAAATAANGLAITDGSPPAYAENGVERAFS